MNLKGYIEREIKNNISEITRSLLREADKERVNYISTFQSKVEQCKDSLLSNLINKDEMHRINVDDGYNIQGEYTPNGFISKVDFELFLENVHITAPVPFKIYPEDVKDFLTEIRVLSSMEVNTSIIRSRFTTVNNIFNKAIKEYPNLDYMVTQLPEFKGVCNDYLSPEFKPKQKVYSRDNFNKDELEELVLFFGYHSMKD